VVSDVAVALTIIASTIGIAAAVLAGFRWSYHRIQQARTRVELAVTMDDGGRILAVTASRLGPWPIKVTKVGVTLGGRDAAVLGGPHSTPVPAPVESGHLTRYAVDDLRRVVPDVPDGVYVVASGTTIRCAIPEAIQEQLRARWGPRPRVAWGSGRIWGPPHRPDQPGESPPSRPV
jgi:hypothetical protein